MFLNETIRILAHRDGDCPPKSLAGKRKGTRGGSGGGGGELTPGQEISHSSKTC